MNKIIALALSIVMSVSMTSAGQQPNTNENVANTAIVETANTNSTIVRRIGAPILPFGPLVVGQIENVANRIIELRDYEDVETESENAESTEGKQVYLPSLFRMTGYWRFTENGLKYVRYPISLPMYKRPHIVMNNNSIDTEANETEVAEDSVQSEDVTSNESLPQTGPSQNTETNTESQKDYVDNSTTEATQPTVKEENTPVVTTPVETKAMRRTHMHSSKGTIVLPRIANMDARTFSAAA